MVNASNSIAIAFSYVKRTGAYVDELRWSRPLLMLTTFNRHTNVVNEVFASGIILVIPGQRQQKHIQRSSPECVSTENTCRVLHYWHAIPLVCHPRPLFSEGHSTKITPRFALVERHPPYYRLNLTLTHSFRTVFQWKSHRIWHFSTPSP